MRRMLLVLVVVVTMGAFAAVMAFAAGRAGCQTDPETGETIGCGGGGGGGNTRVEPDRSTTDTGGGGSGGHDRTTGRSRGGGEGGRITTTPDGNQASSQYGGLGDGGSIFVHPLSPDQDPGDPGGGGVHCTFHDCVGSEHTGGPA